MLTALALFTILWILPIPATTPPKRPRGRPKRPDGDLVVSRTISLRRSLWTRLEATAKALGVTLSEAVRRGVDVPRGTDTDT